MRTPRFIVLAATGCIAAATACGQGTPALTYVQGNFAYLGGPISNIPGAGYTYGWRFTANSNFTVNALALADTNAPGFALSHTMFLWDASGNVLRTAVAPAGDAGASGTPGANQFRYYDITPIDLTAGQTYMVGVGWPAVPTIFVSTDTYYSVEQALSWTFDPRITWTDSRISGALNFLPTQSLGTDNVGRLNLGACNFRIAPQPCPTDLNADAVTDTSDLVLFLVQFGRTISPAGTGPDFDGDGTVTTADLTRLLIQFGRPCP